MTGARHLDAEAERLRIAAGLDADDRARTPRFAAGAPAITARTRSAGSYPTAAQRYYAMVATEAFGAEVEGQAGTLTPGSGTFYALNLGATVPPVGTDVICTFAGGRWVFRYD